MRNEILVDLALAGLVLAGTDLPWWTWAIWVAAVLIRVLGRDDEETEKQAAYIDDLCDERGLSRKEAAKRALGKSKSVLTKREASTVIDWLLGN